MERLSIDEVIEHCKRHTNEVEKSVSIALLENGDMDYSAMKRYWEHRQVTEWLEQLKAYKEAEKQGLLLRLPCKVGSIIYVIPSITNYRLNILNGYEKNNRVYRQCVHSIQMFNNDTYIMMTCEGWASVLGSGYKETWFLTEEEAEQALKQIGE